MKEIVLNLFSKTFRSSRPEVFCRKGVLRDFTKFTGKHLCESLYLIKVAGRGPATLLKKRLWQRCFPVNFVKFLRTPFFKEHLWWLLLNFVLDYFDKNWSDVLQIDQQDVNLSINSILESMNSILDEHALSKWINKYILKFKSKPWIIPAIQKSNRVKNNVKRFINSKDSQTKKIFHKQCKDSRNKLSTFLEKAKQIIIANILQLIWTILKLPGNIKHV